MNRLGFEIVGGSAVGGTVDLDAHTGRYTFTPTAGFSGAASFRYRVNDGQLGSAEKQVDLTVLPGGQQPSTLTFDDAEALLNAGDFDGWTHAVVRLADAGDANAGYHYGTWLADGINGIARDKAMARHYLELAVNIVPDANLQLATLYGSGEGGARDYGRARELLEALPEDRTAIYRLATLDDLGLGAPQDRQRAVEGYIEAARLGSAEAAYTLGRRYLLGEGVTASAEDAYFWLGLGLKFNAAPDNPIFRDLLTLNMGTAAESLTSQQIVDLDAAILDWDAGEATPVNDAPLLGGADTVGGQAIPGATVSGILAQGSDLDGERPTFIVVSGTVENGTLVLDPDTGAFTFTPTAGFTGTGSFDYRVTDSQATSAVRTVSFAIEAPTAASADLGGTAEDAALSVPVSAGLLANDFAAISGGVIAVSAVEGLAGNVGAAVAGDWGSLTVQADGSWLYTPADGARALLEGEVVTDTFAYTITDESGHSSTSTLVVTVNGRDGTVLNGSGVIIGTAFGDEISGGTGSDVLIGLGGDDRLVGGSGAGNELYGGTGNDTYVVSNAGDSVIENADEGTDIVLSGAAAHTLGANVENLTYTGTTAFTGVGNGLANVILGGTASDLLIGLGGNDTLVGGSGAANEIYGGTGDDLYIVASAGDSLIESAGEGTDTVQTALAAYTLTASNIENLTFMGTGGFSGTGSDSANTITGGQGDDRLSGRGGIDTLVGGMGSDTADYSAAVGAVTAQLNSGRTTNDGDGASDILSGIENLTGSAFDDLLIGDGMANVLTGGLGRDTLLGLAGADVLIGGSGLANQMQGGAGDDRYIVSVVGDTLIELAGEGLDTVETILDRLTLAAQLENLGFTGTGAFTGLGNGLANVITGGTSRDVLLGLAGNDTLIGGAGTANELYGGTGDDTYVISAVGDTIVEAAGEGFDTVQTTLSAYTLRNEVEAVTFTGSGAFTGNGSVQDNTLTGGDGDDTLAGHGGIDRLVGGGGTDTASYASAAAGVDVRLNGSAPSARNDGDGATDILISIENLTGSAFDDLLVGDGASNVLSGGLGRDTLLGLGGNDRLVGGSGAANQMQGGQGDDTYVLTASDTVVELSGEGTDTVETTLSAYTLGTNVENLAYLGTGAFTGTGNAAANTLTGGTGADVLKGLGGDDILHGGAGTDVAVMQGLQADYLIEAVDGGYRLTDRTADRDGVDMLFGMESVRFANGATVALSSLLSAPVLAGKDFDPLVLPGEDAAGGSDPALLFGASREGRLAPVLDEVSDLARPVTPWDDWG